MVFTPFIVDACRTPGGKRNGQLSHLHAVDLGTLAVDGLIDRIPALKAAPHLIDDVIVGCVGQLGEQSYNVGRMIVLASENVPESVPGTTIDRQCGSSLQALHFAAQAVMSGVQDIVIAAGVESMSHIPLISTITVGEEHGFGCPEGSVGLQKNYSRALENGGRIHDQFRGSEIVSNKYGITREDCDAFGLLSQQRAKAARDAGHFDRELIKIPPKGDKAMQEPRVFKYDEGIRDKATAESMKKLKPMQPGGTLTAAAASQICDGSSACLVANERGLAKLGLKPRAKVSHMAVVGSDPMAMLDGPIPAGRKVLSVANLAMNDIDLVEVNEAFASVTLAFAKELDCDLDKLNVNGGSIALGHPLAATGTKLVATLLHELERRGQRRGLIAICEGGGTANATIIETLGANSRSLL